MSSVYLQNWKMLEPTCFYKFTKFCQILILTPWFLTLLCFLAKTAQILQKLIVLSLERGEETEPLILTYLDSLMDEVFLYDRLYFSISAIFRRKLLVKVGPPLFINPSISFQAMFLFARVLPMSRISAILDHIWLSKGPKTSQKGPFDGC